MRMFRLEYEGGQPLTNFGFTSYTGSGSAIRAADGRFVLTLTDAGLSSERAAVNTIAHELNHIRESLRGGLIADHGPANIAGNLAEEYFR